MTDLDYTANCPVAAACESCGATDDLAVATAGTAIGVYCLTLCGGCADDLRVPESSGGWPGAALRVGAHCEHLGITVDRMAEIEAERDGDML